MKSKSGNALVNGSASIISTFALQHMKTAVLFHNKAKELEEKAEELKKKAIELEKIGMGSQNFNFEEIRSFVSATVMFSTASLEALINELILNNFEHDLKKHDLENKNKKIMDKGTLDRYQWVLGCLKKAAKINGEFIPHQDVNALFKFRNALTHFKPNWKYPVDLIQLLDGKYELSPFADSESDFVTKKSMSADCSKWAVFTALVFLEKFDSHANLYANKMAAFRALKDLIDPKY